MLKLSNSVNFAVYQSTVSSYHKSLGAGERVFKSFAISNCLVVAR